MNNGISSVIITENAAISDLTDYPNLNPKNIVTLYGLPGYKFYATTSIGASIVDDNIDVDQITLTLDETGAGHFYVRSPFEHKNIENSEEFSAFVMISPQEDMNKVISFPLIFGNYRQSDEAIVFTAYNYTTGAPADGKTPCSIYLFIDRENNDDINQIRIRVNNNAVIEGYNKDWADIPLKEDGSATVNVTSNTAGKVNVWLTAPDSDSGDTVNFVLSFRPIPMEGEI
ncbi:hypothetical protein [Photorhabdus heterorhabditis]|uniref:Uncharacterized protein n=1 Tax=Photorhabdus heterorhabditis TaxID=880156 RepID=A0A5B0VYU9_9GAMM|nr:hypothetical protein [Photorhabdus heterorhabditis]KAA1179712.1 hypothetical protein F0L16_18180 [Photorhabdus heterorhabditis]KOY60768.1 hypothetical protein AM629_17410 [Photorhabdus heterorhabditis]